MFVPQRFLKRRVRVGNNVLVSVPGIDAEEIRDLSIARR